MAKQNVTFIERHVEKMVLGLTGAVVLAIAVLYVVGTPYKVDSGGEELNPKTLVGKIALQADQARLKIKSAKAVEPTNDKVVVPQGGLNVYESAGISLEIPVPLVSVGAPVPSGTDGGDTPPGGKIHLASVAAPRGLVGLSGRVSARLAAPEVVDLGKMAGGAPPAPGGGSGGIVGVTRDIYWATLFAAVSYAEQRELFRSAQYDAVCQDLIVASVEAERAPLLPTGEWGEPVVVKGYVPFELAAPETITLRRNTEGNLAVEETDRDTIVAYRRALEQVAVQQQILRPAFFENYTDEALGWKPPKELPGVQVNLEEFLGPNVGQGRRPMSGFDIGMLGGRRGGPEGMGRRGPMMGPEGPGRGGPGGGVRRPPPGPDGGPDGRAPSGRAEATKTLKEAKDDIDKKKYLEAEEKLQSLLSFGTSGDLNKSQLDEVNRLRKEIQPEVEALLIKKQKEERLAVGAPTQMKDIEPLWFNDNSVAPGVTYRYRLRLVVFNQYIGRDTKLVDPQDAGKVVIRGQWSDWSEPIAIKPSLYLFLTAVPDDGKKVKLAMREWARGELKSGTVDKEVGEVVACKVDRKDLSYDAILAGVETKRTVLLRNEVNGKVNFSERQGGAAILISTDGDVEERFTPVDAKRNAQLDKDWKDEKDRNAQNDPTAVQPTKPETAKPPKAGQPPKAPDRKPLPGQGRGAPRGAGL